jgi:hypothetical protein
MPSDQYPPEREANWVLPGIDPRKLNPQQFNAGTFAQGAISIQQYLPWINIFNNQQTGTFSFTVRTAGGAPGIVQTIILTNGSAIAVPTATYSQVAPPTSNANYTYCYSPLPVIINSGNVQGTNVSGSIAVYGIDPAGYSFQAYTGSGNAPCSGVWHFSATLAVASTPLTVNTVSLLPVGTIASIASTSIQQEYEYPVAQGSAYAIAGGTVVTGWVGPA